MATLRSVTNWSPASCEYSAGTAVMPVISGRVEADSIAGRSSGPQRASRTRPSRRPSRLRRAALVSTSSASRTLSCGSCSPMHPVSDSRRDVSRAMGFGREPTAGPATGHQNQPISGSVVKIRAMAERAGFEPAMECYPHTRLAGECLQPLGHLSRRSGECRASTAPNAARRRVDTPGQSKAGRPARARAAARIRGPGGVAERLNATVLKTVRRVTPVSRVRIPPPPCPLAMRTARGEQVTRGRDDNRGGSPCGS